MMNRCAPRSFRFWTAAAALSVAAAVGCASPNNKSGSETPGESSADKHYDVAVGSFHQGMFEDAKLQLDKALQVDPEHADSYYLRGVLQLNEGKSIVQAIQIDQCLIDDAADQQRDRAEILHREALQSFSDAVDHYDDGAAGKGRAFNSMSVVDLYFQDNEAAIEHAEKALEQQFYTDRYSALSNLGWAHYNLGDLVSAMAELRQAVLINPDFCVGQYRLAQVYLDANQPEKAVEHAQAVLQNERCPIQDAHRILGVAHMRMGSREPAAQAFQSCVTLAPRSCLAQDCEKLLGNDGSADRTMAHVSPPSGAEFAP
jgi:Tfp pilus assembly protein PilF